VKESAGQLFGFLAVGVVHYVNRDRSFHLCSAPLVFVWVIQDYPVCQSAQDSASTILSLACLSMSGRDIAGSLTDSEWDRRATTRRVSGPMDYT
jgi:hypothetical protein